MTEVRDREWVFEEGLNDSYFEAGWNMAGLKGEIYDVCDKMTDRGAMSFKQRGGEGVEGACGRFGFTDDLLDLLLHCGVEVR